MALAAGTIFEIRTTGSDTNGGGGFDTGNANMLTNGAATLATSSAPVFTSASYNFVAGDVGAWLYIKSGTSWTAGWYQIASVAANAATLSAAVGAGVLASGLPTTVVGCGTTASPTSATFAIDYSQQDAVQVTYTDLVIDATTNTKATSAAFPIGQQAVGNIWNVTSGTGFSVQRAQLVSVAANVGTFDKSLGTLGSTGGNAKMGGALSTPGFGASLAVAGGNKIYVKAGTYTLSSSSSNVTGGRVTLGNTESAMIGYSSVRSDMGTRPVINAGAITSITVVTLSTSQTAVINIEVDGNTGASNIGFGGSGAGATADRCLARGCPSRGFEFTGVARHYRCHVTGASIGILTSASHSVEECTATLCAATGIYIRSGATARDCIAYANTTVGFEIEQAASASARRCTAYANGSHGFNIGTGSVGAHFIPCIDCLAVNNTTTGFLVVTGATLRNCAAYNNGTNYSTPARLDNCQTLTIDPFISAATLNFALNGSSGGGLPLRSAAAHGVLPVVLTTGYKDIGAAQSIDSTTWTPRYRRGV